MCAQKKGTFLAMVSVQMHVHSSMCLQLVILWIGTCIFYCVGYQQYKFWRERALQHIPLPHITLFLDAPPTCCYERIHKRGRVRSNFILMCHTRTTNYGCHAIISCSAIQGKMYTHCQTWMIHIAKSFPTLFPCHGISEFAYVKDHMTNDFLWIQ